jgi:hypothetical protein
MDMQKFIDAMGDSMRQTRSDYHVTLGEMIETLKRADKNAPVIIDRGGAPDRLCSYRGYYADLAFGLCERTTVDEVLRDCEFALGHTFEGYKGGNYVMGEDTPLWVSEWGSASGLAVIAVNSCASGLVLVTKEID